MSDDSLNGRQKTHHLRKKRVIMKNENGRRQKLGQNSTNGVDSCLFNLQHANSSLYFVSEFCLRTNFPKCVRAKCDNGVNCMLTFSL